jgi:ligand-binding sensor domain-containing protein
MIKRLFLFQCIMLQSIICFSQAYQFRHYSVEDGLAQSQVYSICQDKKGYMWFATYGGGVSKFDGRSFQSFNTSSGISSNRVWVTLPDKKGNLWLGTDEGLSCYDGLRFFKAGEKDSITKARIYAMSLDKQGNIWSASSGMGIFAYDGKNFKNFREKDGIPMDRVYAAACDSNGLMWFGTYGKGVFSFDGKSVKTYTTADGLNSDFILSLYTDKKGVLWAGTNDGLCRFDGKKISSFSEKEFPKVNVNTIYQDSKGFMWIGTNGNGIYKYNPSKNTFQQYNYETGLDNKQIYAICEDHEGNMWFGTFGGGVSKLSKLTFRYITSREGLLNSSVWAVCRDSKNNLWLGTNGGGLSRFDGKTLKHFTTKEGLSHEMIYCIREDSKGNLWIGTDGGLSKFDGNKFRNYTMKEGLPNNSIWYIMEDTQGMLWLGSNGGITRFDPANGQSTTWSEKDGLGNYRVRYIHEDRNRNIWIATNGGGINIFNPDKAEAGAKNFRTINKENGLSNNIVFSITEDHQGNFWFGTFGGGLVRYSPGKDKNQFSYITTTNGLNNDQIMSMAIDKNEQLWIGTINGLNKLDLNKYNTSGKTEVIYYGKEEGFKGIECNQNSVYLEKDGSIWFGTMKGAILYDPSKDFVNPVEPLTHITELKLFLSTIDWKKQELKIDMNSGLPYELKLPYDQNHVTFEFTGLSFMIPEKVSYKFRLQGFEKEWSPVTKSTIATYANLNPGHYTFEVLAANNDGIWNSSPAKYSFDITPPFWETYWYYAAQVTILVSLISLTFYLNRSKKGNKLATVFLFVSVFVIFEFINNQIEPYFDQFIGGASLIKTFMNLIVAVILIPMEGWLKKVFTGKSTTD